MGAHANRSITNYLAAAATIVILAMNVLAALRHRNWAILRACAKILSTKVTQAG